MADVVAILSLGAVFLDDRGGERGMRVSWHADAGVVVLSLWRVDACVATFRLPLEEVPELVGVLVRGLAESGGRAPAPRWESAAG